MGAGIPGGFGRTYQSRGIRWPPLAEVIAHLDSQRVRLGKLIGELSEAELGRPSAVNPKRSVRSAILHGLHDEACHCGEMYLLQKMQAVGES